MLRALRDQKPVAAAAVQFTGGEPTIHPRLPRHPARPRGRWASPTSRCATNGMKFAEPGIRASRRGRRAAHALPAVRRRGRRVYRRTRGRTAAGEEAQVHRERARRPDEDLPRADHREGGERRPGRRRSSGSPSTTSTWSARSATSRCRSPGGSPHDLEAKRYTLGDLAGDRAGERRQRLRDFYPLSVVTPVSRFMEAIEGKPKIRPSCHADCGIGTYFFVTPEREAVPIPQVFDLMRLINGLNDLAAEIAASGAQARPTGGTSRAPGCSAQLPLAELRPRHQAVRSSSAAGLTNKTQGPGEGAKDASYKTMTAGHALHGPLQLRRRARPPLRDPVFHARRHLSVLHDQRRARYRPFIDACTPGPWPSVGGAA